MLKVSALAARVWRFQLARGPLSTVVQVAGFACACVAGFLVSTIAGLVTCAVVLVFVGHAMDAP